MKALIVAAVVGLVMVLGACSSQTAHGTVEGKLLMTGGMRDVQSPTPGVITIRSSDGKNTVVHVNADGRFRHQVPSGSYSLTGRSPRFDSSHSFCFAPRHVTVQDGSAVAVDVLCQMK